jgi:diguanylate cyclase (GGDEF)-like protein/PAS domain S-box-containing protein
MNTLLKNPSYRSILDDLYDGMYVVDKDRVIQYWNKAAENITGFRAEEVIGKSCAQNILTHVDNHGCNLCKGSCPLLGTIKSGSKNESQVFLHHKAGHRIAVEVRINALHDDEGNVIGGVELFRPTGKTPAIQERMKELEKLALLDKLTGIANRHLIDKEISTRLHELREAHVPFGVVFADVDHFKTFNDTHGHDAGDKVLCYVANTLSHNLRTFDLAGRWGGEEFLCVLRNITDGALKQAANRLRMLVETAYLMQADEKLQVTVSIGATMAKPDDTPDSLCKRADELMYKSKSKGRNRVTVG